jgi:hypothetical protein
MSHESAHGIGYVLLPPSPFFLSRINAWFQKIAPSSRRRLVIQKKKSSFHQNCQLVRLSLSAESAAIQQCFSLTTNQRTVLSATINQRNEQAVVEAGCDGGALLAFGRHRGRSLTGCLVREIFWFRVL